MVNQSGHNALAPSGRVSVKFWRVVANCVFDRRLLTVSLTVARPYPHNSLLHTQLKMAPEVGLGYQTLDLLGIFRALFPTIQYFSGTILPLSRTIPALFLLHTLLHTSNRPILGNLGGNHDAAHGHYALKIIEGSPHAELRARWPNPAQPGQRRSRLR